MELHRHIAPPITSIKEIIVPSLVKTELSNKVPLYYLNMGEQEVSRIDIMVSAGKWEQSKPLVSSFTNLLLKEGAGKLHSKEIAEQLDYYGAWLQLAETYHYSYLTLYTLNRYFKETLEILEMIFREPHFPEKEFKTMVDRHRQHFFIDNDKVQYLATKGFSQKLFQEGYPYGIYAEADDFGRLSTEDLKKFHQRYYRPDHMQIILSGKITDTELKIVDEYFGTTTTYNEVVSHSTNADLPGKEAYNQPYSYTNKRFFIPKKDALQNGIRMGLPVINRNHPDFPGLRVLNTILGGYFGSRLMSNIREEKGYTYGISSGITALKHASHLSIATQTACEHTDKLIREVYNEIDRLQQELTGTQELEMVRNYMLGDFARSMDGTFSIVEAHISLLSSHMDASFFNQQIEVIKNISPDEIQRLAQKYLVKKQILEVIAGETISGQS